MMPMTREPYLNFFDAGVISFFNSFAHRWLALDMILRSMATNDLIKGGIIAATIWWAWFRPSATRNLDRQILSSGVFAGFLSLLVARSFAKLLPYRERPMHNPELHFQAPYGANENILIHWSSFPSDHAALFFALALAIFFVSRRVGIWALCYAFFIVSLPRIYMGFHYPTDILAGAIIGAGSACLCLLTRMRTAIGNPVLRWSEQFPGLFYAGFFLVTFQIAVTFDPVRHLARYLKVLFISLFFEAT